MIRRTSSPQHNLNGFRSNVGGVHRRSAASDFKLRPDLLQPDGAFAPLVVVGLDRHRAERERGETSSRVQTHTDLEYRLRFPVQLVLTRRSGLNDDGGGEKGATRNSVSLPASLIFLSAPGVGNFKRGDVIVSNEHSLRMRPDDHMAARACSTASGARSMIVRSTRLGPSGVRLCCSQSFSVESGTAKRAENALCVMCSLLRTALTSMLAGTWTR